LKGTTRLSYLYARKKLKEKKLSCDLWSEHDMSLFEKAEKSQKNALWAAAEGSNSVFMQN
jgi:hypothetical protein